MIAYLVKYSGFKKSSFILLSKTNKPKVNIEKDNNRAGILIIIVGLFVVLYYYILLPDNK